MDARAPKTSAPPSRPSSGTAGAELSPPAPPRSSARAFLAALLGVDDDPADPHRGVKWLARIAGLGLTGFFGWNAIRGLKAAHRAGYREARAKYAPAARDTARRRR